MTTESRIKAVLTATPEQLAAVDAVLAGTAAAPCRVLRRRAVAAMLGCSPRTVDAPATQIVCKACEESARE